MSGEPMSEDRWGMFADELELTAEERREFMEGLELMPRRPDVTRQRDLLVHEILRQVHHEEQHEKDPETHTSSCACCCIDCDAEETETVG